jgi:hypothetical protein
VEFRALFDKPGVPFQDLVRAAIAVGGAGIVRSIVRHPLYKLVRITQRQVSEPWSQSVCLVGATASARQTHQLPPVKHGVASGQYVAELDAGRVPVGAAPEPAQRVASAFLASDGKLLLVLGDAGSGKSLFMWTCVDDKLAAL